MKNKKGNVLIIAIIIAIVALTAGVVGYLFAKKTQAPVAVPVATQPVAKTLVVTQQAVAQNEIVSNNTEKEKIINELRECDWDVIMKMQSLPPEAIIYNDEKGTFTGFSPKEKVNLPKESEGPIIKISSDGQEIAFYSRLCSNPKFYVCIDANSNAIEIVSDGYAKVLDRTSCIDR